MEEREEEKKTKSIKNKIKMTNKILKNEIEENLLLLSLVKFMCQQHKIRESILI